MFRKIIILKLLLLLLISGANSSIFLIGHAYGPHGEKNIPYEPLKNFLKKNKNKYIFFLGDMTEDSNDFIIFDNYFFINKRKYIRGNHDGNLYEKADKWSDFKIDNLNIINLDMDSNMKFNYNILNQNNKIFLTHHVFFNQVFEKISPANYMENNGINIEEVKLGKNNYFIAGDCGAYKLGYSYLYAEYKDNYFICTGLGSGWANNVFDILNKEPIFFRKNGDRLKHFCIVSDNGKYADVIKICLPKYNLNSIYMSLKFFKNLYIN